MAFNLVATAPLVALLAPTNGAVLVSGSTVTLSAQATSGGGPAQIVTYYLDGNVLGGVSTPYNFSWTANPSGYHVLSAIATDAEGQTSEPSMKSVFVQAALSNPVLIDRGSDWRYLADGSNQGTTWIPYGFNDGLWPSGQAKFGFNNNGNSGIATVLGYGGVSTNKYRAYYFRKQFVVPAIKGMTNLLLEVQRDDGIAVYLNGVPFYRNNLPNGTLSYSQLATNATDNGNNWRTSILPLTGMVQGTNVISAEVHQSSISSSDLGFDLRLTLLGTAFAPAITTQPQNQTRSNGESASFSVQAIGTAPLAYRWMHNGANFPGATTNSLVIPAAFGPDVGAYQVVVSNAIGSVTSLVADLTIMAVDSDGDGMPDDWEQRNGTNPAGERCGRGSRRGWPYEHSGIQCRHKPHQSSERVETAICCGGHQCVPLVRRDFQPQLHGPISAGSGNRAVAEVAGHCRSREQPGGLVDEWHSSELQPILSDGDADSAIRPG